MSSDSLSAHTLPDHCPAVSVSIELGQLLADKGKTIEVDFESLKNIFEDLEVTEEAQDKTEIHIASRLVSPKLGRAGEAWFDTDSDNYGMAIYLSWRQLYGMKKSRLQSTVIHEAQHISDYVADDVLNEPDPYFKRAKYNRNRSYIGRTVATAAGIALVPITYKVGLPVMEKIHDPALISTALVAPLEFPFVSYVAAKRALYKTELYERRANKAAKKLSGKHSPVVTIYNSNPES